MGGPRYLSRYSDSLRTGRSNPGGGRVFRTGPEAHPASHTMGTGSFPGVKRGVHPPSSAEVKARVELYIYLLGVLVACSMVNFTFNL